MANECHARSSCALHSAVHGVVRRVSTRGRELLCTAWPGMIVTVQVVELTQRAEAMRQEGARVVKEEGFDGRGATRRARGENKPAVYVGVCLCG